MPFKRDENGNLAVGENGAPIRVDANGKEFPFGDDVLDSTLHNLESANAEAAKRKTKIREMEQKLKAVEDIEDLNSWRQEADKAIQTAKNLDDKKLVDAGEVEKVKKSVSDAYEKKLEELNKSLEAKDSELYKQKVSNRFKDSKALEKTNLLPDFAEAYFGKHFKIEDGQVVGYIGDEPIRSEENPGKLADFDEALTKLIDQHPRKDSFLKGAPPGGGTPPNGGSPPKGDWRDMKPTDRLNAAREGKIK